MKQFIRGVVMPSRRARRVPVSSSVFHCWDDGVLESHSRLNLFKVQYGIKAISDEFPLTHDSPKTLCSLICDFAVSNNIEFRYRYGFKGESCWKVNIVNFIRPRVTDYLNEFNHSELLSFELVGSEEGYWGLLDNIFTRVAPETELPQNYSYSQ